MDARTKIIATLGPACGNQADVSRLVDAGCDCARINLAHGTPDQHTALCGAVRRVERERGTPLAVLADLCGPKIRVGPIIGGSVLLADGQEIAIARDCTQGRADRIATTLAELVGAARIGDPVLLDDGRIRLRVEDRDQNELRCRVERGGILAAGKGVNLPQTPLELSALTEKDRRDLDWIADRAADEADGGIDYVALSFVRTSDDVKTLRAALDERGCAAQIIAKIEKPQAMDNIDAIVDAADAVMVARGDLGVEMDLPAVPIAQKRIARKCQAANTPCIIATQMLETMTSSPSPTRAEVSDVANAVLDHADAVMLSGETAVGTYPVRAVRVMNDIVEAAQAYHDETYRPLAGGASDSPAALAQAVEHVVACENIAAVAVYTISGRTARLFAKRRLPVPILALSPHRATLRRLALDYGVVPAEAAIVEHTREALALAERRAAEHGLAKPGQTLAVVTGRPITQSGTANTLVLHVIGEDAA
ncbi:MAG: pyruvate kinase [Phycisphaerae bacterium]|nr:pyruvate kinase [Phycisphaerae bacterium]